MDSELKFGNMKSSGSAFFFVQKINLENAVAKFKGCDRAVYVESKLKSIYLTTA